MLLHTPTLFAVIVLVSLFLAASLFYIGHRRHVELIIWAMALALAAFTHVVFGLRPWLPLMAGIIVPNLALSASYALFAEGIYHFQGRKPPRGWVWGPVLLAGLFLGTQPHDIAARVLGMSVINGFQIALLLRALWQFRTRTAGRGQYLLVAGLLVLSSVYLLRATLAWLVPEQVASIDSNQVGQAIGFSLSTLSLLLIALGMVVMLEERTEANLQAAAEQVRTSETHYRTLIEAANEGICVLQDGRVRYANPRLYALTGYTPEQILNQPFLHFLHPDDRQAALELHQRRLQGEAEQQQQTLRLITAHLGERWFQTNGVQYEWQGAPASLTFLDDITERKQREDQVLGYAYRDALTELPNRRALLEQLPGLITALHHSGQHGALLFLDLDNFKPLNDQEGHSVGDLLLVEVGRRLRQATRPHDLVARFGGDEFVVVLQQLDPNPEVANAQAHELAQRLQLRLNAPYSLTIWRNEQAQTLTHHCTVSVGVRLFNGQAANPDNLLEHADKAMYQAKQAGRNQVAFSPTAGVATASSRMFTPSGANQTLRDTA